MSQRRMRARRDRGAAFAAAGQAQPVGRRGGDRHRRADHRGQRRLRLGPARADARRVADHLHRDVGHRPARLAEQPHHLAQQRHPGRAGPLRVVGAEHRAQVAHAGRRQQRVAGRVRGHVAVGVPGAAVVARPQQPGQPAVPAGLERVDVHPDPGPQVAPVGSFPARRLGVRDVQLAVGVAGAQHLLVELADAGLGHLVDERPVLRHLPAGDLAVEELRERGRVDVAARRRRRPAAARSTCRPGCR